MQGLKSVLEAALIIGGYALLLWLSTKSFYMPWLKAKLRGQNPVAPASPKR